MLIAIEGIDGSGKGTQTTLLQQHLLETGISTAKLGFPRYEATAFGKRVAEFLNGCYGNLANVDPFLVANLYAGDRFESRQLIEQLLSTHQVLLCDRYTPSNLAYQLAKVDPSRRSELQSWIEHLEYHIYQLPRPDLVIYLELDAHTSQQLVLKKDPRDYTESPLDLHEAAQGYLGTVRQEYLNLAQTQPSWRIINCRSQGHLRTIEEIAQEVLQVTLQSL